MEMEMAEQWRNLFMLADTAMSVSESEKASEYSTSSPSSSSRLCDDPDWFSAPIKKKKRTAVKRKPSPVMVVEKRLTKTDVTRNNNRLSLTGQIPRKNLERFLRKDERRSVKEKAGLEVIVVDGLGREYGLALKRWKMGSTDIYNLISKWNSVASDNGLRKNDVVRVFAFRRGDKPCFAVVKLSD